MFDDLSVILHDQFLVMLDAWYLFVDLRQLKIATNNLSWQRSLLSYYLLGVFQTINPELYFQFRVCRITSTERRFLAALYVTESLEKFPDIFITNSDCFAMRLPLASN